MVCYAILCVQSEIVAISELLDIPGLLSYQIARSLDLD